jgi:hypothetical protein
LAATILMAPVVWAAVWGLGRLDIPLADLWATIFPTGLGAGVFFWAAQKLGVENRGWNREVPGDKKVSKLSPVSGPGIEP